MNKYRLFRTLLIPILVLITLVTSTGQVKAYGHSIITANCPTITFSATTDRPLTSNVVGENYIIAWINNYTTDDFRLHAFFPYKTASIVTPTGSSYIRYTYRGTINLVDLHWVSPGDNYSFDLRDATGSLGKISGVCTDSTIASNSTPSSPFRLNTIICEANILSSPAGPVVTFPPIVQPMPEVGKQR